MMASNSLERLTQRMQSTLARAADLGRRMTDPKAAEWDRAAAIAEAESLIEQARAMEVDIACDVGELMAGITQQIACVEEAQARVSTSSRAQREPTNGGA
jgi:hypothetical protein